MEWVRTEALGQTKLAFDDLVNQLKRRRFKHRRTIIKKNKEGSQEGSFAG